MKIKVCGMGSAENIQQIAALQPDYLGFIFFEKSARNFTGEIPEIASTIKKTGVFVNASFDFIQQKIKQYGFKAVQLHGEENPEFCQKVKALNVEVFKVFSMKSNFDFSILKPFETSVDYFLFDTKGENPGGNGFVFDWEILKKYNSEIPFILSGGIGIQEVDALKDLMQFNLPIYALDINSKFEIQPALKNAALVNEFIDKIKNVR